MKRHVIRVTTSPGPMRCLTIAVLDATNRGGLSPVGARNGIGALNRCAGMLK